MICFSRTQLWLKVSKPAITSSKLTIEALEHGVKYVESYQ